MKGNRLDSLGELKDHYGDGAVLTVRPYVLDSGVTLRWVLEIDGLAVPDADVRLQAEGPGIEVMLLVLPGEQVEIGRWSAKMYPHGPAAVIRRLGDLKQRF